MSMLGAAVIPEEDQEKWVGYYSSRQRILLIGEGDFSFSACLARWFGSARNIVATSYDRETDLTEKYTGAAAHLSELHIRGGVVIHGVNACNVHTDLKQWRGLFDRVVFNFPHAGHKNGWGGERDERLIREHRKLLLGFLRSAARVVAPKSGEVHITHQDGGPYTEWGLEELASSVGLVLVHMKPFCAHWYPGYQRKRGGSIHADGEFRTRYPVYTFMFKLQDDGAVVGDAAAVLEGKPKVRIDDTGHTAETIAIFDLIAAAIMRVTEKMIIYFKGQP